MKWKTLMVTATLSTLLLAACGTDNANDTAMRNQDNTLRNVNYNPNNTNGYPNDNFTNNVNNRNNNGENNQNQMAVADKAAEKIVSMREVDQANVIVTDNNAYVAAKLANQNGNRLEKEC